MSVVRQLAQAVLLLVLLGCPDRLVATAISNNRTQRQDATVDDPPIWVRDQRGGGCSQATSAATPKPLSHSASASTPRPARRDGDLLLLRRPPTPRPGGTEVWPTPCFTTAQSTFGDVQAATDAATDAAQRHQVYARSPGRLTTLVAGGREGFP
jgi:hypothetical protein